MVERSCSFQHGTEIASIIFGQHDTRTHGIAPGCRGFSIPVFECSPAGNVGAAQIDLARAISLARDRGAKIVNISAGQQAAGYGADADLLNAVRDCSLAGVLIVAAAGNDGCNCLHIPAALPNVLSVGAMTSDGRPLASSNWGAPYQTSGILAPGKNIPVATTGGDVTVRTGTSYATAIVSGVVGLLLSRELRLGRIADSFLIRDALLNTAIGCDDAETDCRRFLAGRLNIPGAISYLDRWSTSMTDELQRDAPNHNAVDSQSTSDGEEVSCTDDEVQREVNGRNEATHASHVQWQSNASTATVEPAACAACRGERQLVYALGQLGYDFGTEAGLDGYRQHMCHVLGKQNGEPHPLNEQQLLKFFDECATEPWYLEGLLWTLNQSGSPIYVVQPEGPYATVTYQKLLEFFSDQFKKPDPESEAKSKTESDRTLQVAVPGIITGQATLLNGRMVPVIKPDPRGFCNWTKKKLIEALGSCGPTGEERQELSPEQEQEVDRFLNRIYYELANQGVTSQHRALNYAGTNLFEFKEILGKLGEKRTLDTIEVKESAICRPGSDCWDIVLSFFDPNQLQPVCKIYRYTVDVSDVIPVTVGTLRSWEARTR